MYVTRNILHRSLAGFMAVWLSGFVFLFCCQNMKAATALDSCPLAKMSSHCDKAANAKTDADAVERRESPCFDCCAFLPVVFDQSRKVDVVQKQIAAPAEEIVVKTCRRPELKVASSPFAAFSPRVTDRHGTYLQHCVFRI